MKKQGFRAIQAQRYLRYSIRKFTVGVASVAIATGILMIGSPHIQAAEEATPITAQQGVSSNNKEGKGNKTETENKVSIQLDELQKNLNSVEEKLNTLLETTATKAARDAAKSVVVEAKKVLSEETKTQESVKALAKQLLNQLTILNSMKTEVELKKEQKNNDARNGKAIPGNGESGFREAAPTTNPIIPATEGPTNNNKIGSGNNPTDGVFESAKNQFGDIDFSNATAKNKTVNKQWSRSTASQGGDTKILGSVTYNWKEKEITADEANQHNALNGWKIEGGEKVTAVKPEEPTNVPADRPAEFAPKASKVYDLNGKVHPNENEVPAPNHPLGVNASNQNYANGVNHLGMVGTHNLPKGYYLELGKKGTKISKEYAVNGNSRVMLSAITGGAYGNAGTAGTGEQVKITVYDVITGEKISSVRDDHTIGEKMEAEHVSTPTGSGGNGDGWTEYRAIYEIPKTTTRVKVEIEALNDGTAINNSYLKNTNSTVTDGYFVGAVNLAVGSGAELTTNVRTNRVSGKYGEDNLYKAKQEGTLDITVKSVGGVRHYGSAETEVDIPEGVDLPDNVKKPTGWVWFGGVPVAPQNISWNESTRKLRIKYQTSGNNAGANPYIGIGSNKGNNDGTRNLSIPFKTADNYKGTATFKVRTFLPNGLSDGQDNQSLNTGDVSNSDGKYHPVVNGLRNSDNPEYYYNKTIYIDSTKPTTPTVEAVHTDGVKGEGKDSNQPKKLLISVPEDETGVTNEAREKQDLVENDKNNNKHTLTEGEATTKVDRINHAIGGVTSLKVTLPNGTAPITLTKKSDGWYKGSEKINEVDGKLVLPLPETVNLDEASDSTNPEKRIKVTVYDKAGNESEPAYGEVKNEAPTVAVQNSDLYVYKTKEADKWTNAKVLEKAVPSATDLEDDRNGVESTKPSIAVSDAGNLNTTVVGTYPVKVQSTDSEGKKSTETTVNVHVLDLITVDPTVTTDPTDPSSTSPVSPKTEGTPVKEGDSNRGTYPSGVRREDLVKEVTRTIKYLKEADKDKLDAQSIEPDKVDKIQKVTYKRTATVNPETKEVTYSDWTVYVGADKLSDATVDGTKGKFNEVPSPVVNSYLLVDNADKTVPEKEAPMPTSTGVVTPEVKKVLYKEIGSFIPTYPNGKKPNDAPEKIHYPNHPTDPTKPGDFSTITIPYVPGFNPVYNGVELTPKNPNNPKEGYKVPEGFNPADNFGNSEITYTPSNQKATVVIEKKVDSGTNEVIQSYELTGKSGEELPKNTEIENKIKELKNKGYEVESDSYHTADNHHPTFDDQEDVNPTDGTSAPFQTFKVVVKPRIIEVPVTTPHEKGTPVDPNGENPDLKWPAGLTETDLKTTAKRVISYVKKESDTATEEKAKDSTEQMVTFTRKAKVNLVDKTVEYTDWEASNKTWDKVEVKTLTGYIADKKEVAAKEVPTPTKDTKVIPDETEKVTYTKIGSWTPINPTTGLEETSIPFPNDPKDPTKTGEITEIIPHKDGYSPKDDSGNPLTPVDPEHLDRGYHPPKITDPKANIKITYDKDDQKAKVKFVSVDPKTQNETELTDHTITITGKTGETISERDVQTHIDVLKSMGYDIVDNPFDKDPVFDTLKDTTDKVSQEFTIKLQPRVSTVNPVYVVEGNKPSAEQLKDAVTTKGNDKIVDVTKIPETTGKVGDNSLIAPVTVTYGSGDKKREEIVNVPVKVVKGYPQIISVDEGKKQPSPEDSIEPSDYPEGVTFEYKEPVDTTTSGDKLVTVVVKQGDKVLVEVPATVRVVESYPQFVPVDKDKKQPAVEGSIDPKAFPKDTEFTYETPVDTTTPGEKEVVVVAKIGDKVIAKIPAKVMVVEPKTQYVPVDKSNKQADTSKSIDPEQYPDGVTFKYKTPVDTTTPGEKDVIVEAKDGEDKLVEVPAKVKVVEGKEQLIPVNPAEKPQARDNITPSDYPEGSTFEYKVPDGQTEPFDATTVGDKPVTVVVKDKNGNVLVEVPATIKVVEAKPKPIETPVTNTPLTKDDIAKYVKVPEGGKVTNVENIPDLTIPGKKEPVKVTVTLPNGKTTTVDVPVNVTPVKGIKTPVTKTPLTPEDYTKRITIPEGGKVTKVENTPDLTTPGKKNPVKVTVELPNGKTITVEVPVNVTPVKGIETPVTKTPLKPEDYTKGIKIPEGGKVTNVENIPDLTTPGKKNPVKVTVELPNGKTITVEVPVNVTPATGIETPVTDTPLTKEDIEKHVKVPEGGKIVGVGEIPKVNTPGDKGTVKVKIELPNGKQIEVEVPVKVTPIKDIVKKLGDPITNEDIEKHIQIPEGGKIISIGDKPSTDVPGERPSVPVVIELPGGKRVTIKVPVIVTPKVTPVVVSVGTPVSKEDVEKHIDLPKGWKITKVGDVPTTTSPGVKPAVPVEIELPDGRKITVDVPVIVTPKVTPIVVPQGTPVTPDDVKGHIDLPKEPGWDIVEVGEIPTTIPAGVKPSVRVKIKVPSGEIIEVEVPLIVTPKTTPVIVEVGTPITEDMVKQHIDLPKGWKVTKVGEIPQTNTPGNKSSVPVEIELPDGRKVLVEVPVTVLPKGTPTPTPTPTPSTPTTKITTHFVDENGKDIETPEEGIKEPKVLQGFEYIKTTNDANGNTIHHYKKVIIVPAVAPGSAEYSSAQNHSAEVSSSNSDSQSHNEVKNSSSTKQELPNTGTAEVSFFTPAALAILAGLGIVIPTVRKKKDEE